MPTTNIHCAHLSKHEPECHEQPIVKVENTGELLVIIAKKGLQINEWAL